MFYDDVADIVLKVFYIHLIEETLSGKKAQSIKDTTQWNSGTKPNKANLHSIYFKIYSI